MISIASENPLRILVFRHVLLAVYSVRLGDNNGFRVPHPVSAGRITGSLHIPRTCSALAKASVKAEWRSFIIAKRALRGTEYGFQTLVRYFRSDRA
jgi:hypothetical protein